MKNSINKKIVAFALLAVVSFSTSQEVLANDDKKNATTELKFVGNINNQPVFQLKLDNGADEEFTIIIRDENSNVLYRYSRKEGNYDKKFLLNIEELGDNAVRFEISIGKSLKPVVYEVNRNTRFVDEVVVSKIQ